jgi:hypothetical protein
MEQTFGASPFSDYLFSERDSETESETDDELSSTVEISRDTYDMLIDVFAESLIIHSESDSSDSDSEVDENETAFYD